MTDEHDPVSRKTVKEARIAICPHFGCNYLEKVKPLRFGFLGRRKYPTCPKHKFYMIFVDEFFGNFIKAVKACLNDMSSLPPESLMTIIRKKAPDYLKAFIYGWIYCSPIGRGGQIIPHYMNGLSRGYMNKLSKREKEKPFKMRTLQERVVSY